MKLLAEYLAEHALVAQSFGDRMARLPGFFVLVTRETLFVNEVGAPEDFIHEHNYWTFSVGCQPVSRDGVMVGRLYMFENEKVAVHFKLRFG